MESEFGVCSMSAKLRRVAIRQPSAILSADIDEWHYAKPLNQQVLLQQFSNFVSLLETSGTEILWLDDEDDGLADSNFTYDPSFMFPNILSISAVETGAGVPLLPKKPVTF